MEQRYFTIFIARDSIDVMSISRLLCTGYGEYSLIIFTEYSLVGVPMAYLGCLSKIYLLKRSLNMNVIPLK